MDLPAEQERNEFADRLKLALRMAGAPASPGAFAQQYNLRADGASVSVYAVRKWLHGESIPTQDKIHIISRWLGISAQWLRYGESEVGARDAALHEPRDLQLMNDIRLLGDDQRQLVEWLVHMLLKSRLMP
jgi:transcriptional regulator with XRE-family HTH domain